MAERARSVELDEAALASYAASLPAQIDPPQLDPATHFGEGDREARAAFVVCLGAINFGSGWWPTIRKRPGHSGYFTVAAGIAERFRTAGPWSCEELRQVSATDLAEILGQSPDHPLMVDHAAALRDVGEHVGGEYDGRFTALVEACGGSAPALADLLATWVSFADVSTYDERPVPFFKRAQLVPSDLNRAGIAALREEDRLTAFADNLVPHVLRIDGVLRLQPSLAQAIDGGKLLTHDSPEEVELRACAVQAVELLSAQTAHRLSPAQIDGLLWNRGQQRRYKEVPRPRSRNTAY